MATPLMKRLGLAAAAAVAVASFAGPAHAKKVRWKMHSAFGTNVAVIGPVGPRVSEWVDKMSGGDFDIKVWARRTGRWLRLLRSGR